MKKPPHNLKRTLAISGAVRSDDDKRSVELAFSSESPVDRGWGLEILDHAAGSCDLSRLNNGGALLLDHDPRSQIGVVESARIDKDGFGRAVVRFSRAAEADAIYQDVKDGIRRLVSVGYAVNEWQTTKGEGDKPSTYRAVKWMPFEVSIVSIPADTAVGVGRSLSKTRKGKRDDAEDEPEEHEEDDKADDTREDEADPATSEDDESRDDDAQTDESREHDEAEDDGDESETPPANGEKRFPKAGKNNRNTPHTITMSQTTTPAGTPAEKETARVREIAAIGIRFGVAAETTEKFIRENKSVADFQTLVLDEQAKRHAKPVASIGMSEKEAKRFSLVRAIAKLAAGEKLDGLEREGSDAMAKAIGRDARGFFIPADVLRANRRDLSVGTPADGGRTVETMVDGANLIELLRNKMVTSALGVRTISGVKGHLAIPSQTGGATAQWLTESQLGTSSAQTFGQIVLTPKHLQGSTAFSKQLLAQASLDVEALVRDDLMTVLAIAKDLAVLGGTGANGQPTGIAYTSGIGSVTFGAAATYAKLQAFEAAVENANALLGKCAYVTTPNTKAKLKSVNRFANTFSPLWADDGTVNGYQALSTKQMGTINSIGDGVMFGNFADAIVADWDGFDVVVDPYSLSLNNQVRVVIHHMTDVGVRHAGSFAMSTDSGAQ